MTGAGAALYDALIRPGPPTQPQVLGKPQPGPPQPPQPPVRPGGGMDNMNFPPNRRRPTRLPPVGGGGDQMTTGGNMSGGGTVSGGGDYKGARRMIGPNDPQWALMGNVGYL